MSADTTTVGSAIFSQLVPLNSLSPERQADLAHKARICNAHAGDYLFKVGDSATEAIFVLSGEIHLEDAAGKP